MDLTPENKARFERAAAKGRKIYLERQRREAASIRPSPTFKVLRGGKWQESSRRENPERN